MAASLSLADGCGRLLHVSNQIVTSAGGEGGFDQEVPVMCDKATRGGAGGSGRGQGRVISGNSKFSPLFASSS